MNAAYLAECAGISYRQLDFWTRRGYLQPVGGAGTGHPRYYPSGEVVIAVAMTRLVKAGVTPRTAAAVARGDAAAVAALRKALEEAV